MTGNLICIITYYTYFLKFSLFSHFFEINRKWFFYYMSNKLFIVLFNLHGSQNQLIISSLNQWKLKFSSFKNVRIYIYLYMWYDIYDVNNIALFEQWIKYIYTNTFIVIFLSLPPPPVFTARRVLIIIIIIE